MDMAHLFVLEITETADYLEKKLKQAKRGDRKEGLQMLWSNSGAISKNNAKEKLSVVRGAKATCESGIEPVKLSQVQPLMSFDFVLDALL